MDEDQIPDNLLPWEIEAWKESQATGQPFQSQQDTGLDNFEGTQATRMAAQGVSYNFADEAEAAAVAAATGKPYPEVIQEIRTKLKNYQMENPKAAAAWEFAGGMLPSAVLAYATRGKAKGPVTAEQASSLFTRFFPNVGKTMGFGGAESVVAGIGASEESPLDRIFNASRLAEGATGSAVAGGMYTGGKGLLKGVSLTADLLRIAARRTDKDIVNREIQRIADDAGVSIEQAGEMLANGEAISNNPQVAEALAALRARSPQASQAIGEAQPRVKEVQAEAAETIAGGLGGGMSKNTFTIARANDQKLKKLTDDEYKKVDGVNTLASGELVDQIVDVIQRAPAGGRKIQEAYRSQTGTPFFKVNEAGEIEFLRDPTVLDAEYLMRVVNAEGNKLTEKGGADGIIGINLMDAGNSLRNIIDVELPEIINARSVASNAFQVKDAYNLGKKILGKSPEEVENIFLDLSEAGNQEALDAFRLGFLANLKSNMSGANKTTFINNLLDEANTKGMNLRTIFPESMLDEALEKLGIAQRTQQSFGRMTGGSDTAQKMAAMQRQGSASGAARLISDAAQAGRGDVNSAASILDRIIRQFAPNLSDSQAGRVAEVLISQDPEIVRKALTDRTVLRQVQTTIADVANIPLQSLSQNVGKAAAAAIGQ